MLTFLKLGCLALYALGLVAFAGGLHGTPATVFEVVACALLVIHVLELPFFWTVLRSHRGGFAASVLQALLFGMLHSLPLKHAARA